MSLRILVTWKSSVIESAHAYTSCMRTHEERHVKWSLNLSDLKLKWFHNFSYNFQIPNFMKIPYVCLVLYAYFQAGRRADSTNRKERNKWPIWTAIGECDLDSHTVVMAGVKTVMDFVLDVRRRTSWPQSQLKWRMDDVYQETTKCIDVRRTNKMHLYLINLFLKLSSTCFEQTVSS